MKPEITIDPEFEKLIPPLSADEFASLKEQIREQGCLEPLYVWKDLDTRILLDGHNRYRICAEINRGFETRNLELSSREHAKLWILEHQMGRRNLVLTEDQRAARWNEIRELRTKLAVAQKLQKARAAKAGARISAVPTDIDAPKTDTRKEVAKESGVSESKLRQAQQLKKHRPDLYDKILNGTLKLREANKATKIGRQKKARKDRDYFCRTTRALEKVFRGRLKDALDDLCHLKTEEMHKVEIEEGLSKVIEHLGTLIATGKRYEAKLIEVVRSKKAEAA